MIKTTIREVNESIVICTELHNGRLKCNLKTYSTGEYDVSGGTVVCREKGRN